VCAGGISGAGGSSWHVSPGEGPEDSDCTVRGKEYLSMLIMSVGEPEWGGRSSAGVVWMKTDERDAIDKRVKEMTEKREDPFFSPTIFSSIGYILN
jgi:hypothetical protein